MRSIVVPSTPKYAPQFRFCFRLRYDICLVSEQQRLVPGTLWPQAVAATARARASGALQPIVTTQTVVEEQGIPFLVRVLAGTGRTRRSRLAPISYSASRCRSSR